MIWHMMRIESMTYDMNFMAYDINSMAYDMNSTAYDKTYDMDCDLN